MAVLFHSCANVGMPTGGLYDLDAPQLVDSDPGMGARHVTKTKFELRFDENILLDNPSQNVVVSPSQSEVPEIVGISKKIYVTLNDTLIPNTTYTIDFNDAIKDNNESNILEGFSYVFSTGDVIDSLQLSGRVYDALTHEPMPGVTVGLYRNLADTAFTHQRFDRSTKTNSQGVWSLRNLAPANYKLYALQDMNNDYRYDSKGEAIAFLDSVVVPSVTFDVHMDSVMTDDGWVEEEHRMPIYAPDTIRFRLSTETYYSQRMNRAKRETKGLITIPFAEPCDSLPAVRQLPDEAPLFTGFYQTRKTLGVWLCDSNVWERDTVRLEVSYLQSDSLFRLVPQVDTLELYKPNEPRRKPKEAEAMADSIPPYSVAFDASGSVDIFAEPRIKLTTPYTQIDTTKIRLEYKRDTLWYDMPYTMREDSIALHYPIAAKWEYDSVYRLVIDSLAFRGLFGESNLPMKMEFKIKSANSYGHLYFNLPAMPCPAYVDLVDAQGEVIRTAKAKAAGVLFRNLKPGKYGARLWLDSDSSGTYTPVDYALKRQPELTYFYPQQVEVMQNWEVEQTWDPYALPLGQQKPAELILNKVKGHDQLQKKIEFNREVLQKIVDRQRRREQRKLERATKKAQQAAAQAAYEQSLLEDPQPPAAALEPTPQSPATPADAAPQTPTDDAPTVVAPQSPPPPSEQ